MPAKPWFFLSYASLDHDDYFDQFYKALLQVVRVRVGGAEDEIGFLAGRDIKLGQAWPAELDEALQNCRVFVPVFSASYFLSDYCGREWAAFRERLEAVVRGGGQRPPLIVPVLWGPEKTLGTLPPEIADLQLRLRAFGPEYASEGFQYFMRLDGKKDDRERILNRIATELFDLGSGTPLPPLAVPLHIKQLQNPWRSGMNQLGPPRQPEPPAVGPRYIQFVFVAARSDEVGALSRSVEYYGAQGSEWKPYLPDLPDDIELLTQRISVEQQLRVRDTLPLDGNLIQRLQSAEKERRIVVIVVDTWTLRLNNYRQFMEDYDRSRFSNCIVIVPWNPKDAEVTDQRATLQATVATAFHRIKRDPVSPYFLDSVGPLDDFKAMLSQSLSRLKLELLSDARIYQTAGPATTPQPILLAPGGPSQ